MTIKKIKKIIFISLFIIALFLLLFSVIFAIININNNNIIDGIMVNGIDISGMTKEQALNEINNKLEEKMKNNLVIMNENEQQEIKFDYLEINYDVSNTIDKAYEKGRSNNIFMNNFEILSLLFRKENLNIHASVSQKKVNELASEFLENLPDALVQSNYYIENKKLVIDKGTAGKKVDKIALKENIQNVLENLELKENVVNLPLINSEPDAIDIEKIYDEIYKEASNAYYEKNPLKIHSEVIGVSFDKEQAKRILEDEKEKYEIDLIYTYPEVTIKDLNIDIFKDQLAYFTTSYNMANKDRVVNLELAADKINGTIIEPGEEFSYNKVVGARTISNGYKEAKIYSNGKVVDGVGGGICQVSSTLYNTIIYANLNVTERHNHQFLTSYVPEGRDATVAYGAKDLKFINNRSYPIKIKLSVSNGIVLCAIYRNLRGKRI